MTNQTVPTYFVQTEDGVLHGYFDPFILRMNLLENKDEPVKIYELRKQIAVRYFPVTREEVMEKTKGEKNG